MIFESDEGAIYRKLEKNSCNVPVKKLGGAVKVTVAVLNGSARPRKWLCEGLMAERQNNGGTLISPDDSKLPEKVVKLELQIQELHRGHKALEDKVNKLEERLVKLLEGYDLV